MATIGKNAPQWKKLIESVDIDSLPISYAIGKSFAQYKTIALGDLDLLTKQADDVLGNGGLADDVGALTSLLEFQNQLQAFAGLLTSFEMTDAPAVNRVIAWSDKLTTLANGPVMSVYSIAYPFVLARAAESDVACPTHRK